MITRRPKLDKLDASAGSGALHQQQIAALFADCSLCQTMDVIAQLELTPQQRRQLTLRGPHQPDRLVGRTASPVLMIVEDIHWGDPTT